MVLAAKGLQNKDIAERMGLTPEKVARWRGRYLEGGWEALTHDAPRTGRPRPIPAAKTAKVVKMATEGKPDNATH
ncbi:MAG: helix-turn-helix domain-containing protein [Bryobacteraceae bacterium]